MKYPFFFIAIIWLTAGCGSSGKLSQKALKHRIEETVAGLDMTGLPSHRSRIRDAFTSALLIAYQEDQYSGKSDSLTIEVFETQDKYVFVRFSAMVDLQKVALFRLEADRISVIFENFHSIELWRTYISDLNGDSFLDVIHCIHPPSGCCMGDLQMVRLYNPEIKSFEDEMGFWNPTFDPQNGIIRGIVYGHHGRAPIYKFQWDGSQIDTLAYVLKVKDQDGFYLVDEFTSEKDIDLGPREGTWVPELPEEYADIDGLDWFLGTE
ncbi:hypothetical protein [Pontibacter sp. G13]|uniref:hypothetical protein n=1 Tax=Pontibacter sp. G13 TaxID=3074898 RepID=UPI00288B69DE|nr:hypothetical protein [Pontibacter sp. G13]WNJ18260.1 hypothetical protein RJD25_25695 [Pontibacter sp. G13]